MSQEIKSKGPQGKFKKNQGRDNKPDQKAWPETWKKHLKTSK